MYGSLRDSSINQCKSSVAVVSGVAAFFDWRHVYENRLAGSPLEAEGNASYGGVDGVDTAPQYWT